MNTGMLWWNKANKSLVENVQEATEYYKKKYKRTPDLCLVHPSALEKIDVILNTIPIRPYRPVLPGYLWIGIDEPQTRRLDP